MLSSFQQSMSAVIANRQSYQLKWNKNPFHFHMHHHPQQLTVPCKTIGALDLTDATHTKLEKTRFTCMFEKGGNLVDTSHHFLFCHWQWKSIFLACVDSIHQTPCKHV